MGKMITILQISLSTGAILATIHFRYRASNWHSIGQQLHQRHWTQKSLKRFLDTLTRLAISYGLSVMILTLIIHASFLFLITDLRLQFTLLDILRVIFEAISAATYFTMYFVQIGHFMCTSLAIYGHIYLMNCKLIDISHLKIDQISRMLRRYNQLFDLMKVHNQIWSPFLLLICSLLILDTSLFLLVSMTPNRRMSLAIQIPAYATVLILFSTLAIISLFGGIIKKGSDQAVILIYADLFNPHASSLGCKPHLTIQASALALKMHRRQPCFTCGTLFTIDYATAHRIFIWILTFVVILPQRINH